MAEFVMKDLVSKAGLDDQFYIESAATSTEEIGNEVYPPAKRKLAEHGISCKGKTARQMTRNDYDRFDLLIGMDAWNLRNMNRICGSDPEGKIHLLLDYTNRPDDVADPWYTGNFEATWRDGIEFKLVFVSVALVPSVPDKNVSPSVSSLKKLNMMMQN